MLSGEYEEAHEGERLGFGLLMTESARFSAVKIKLLIQCNAA